MFCDLGSLDVSMVISVLTLTVLNCSYYHPENMTGICRCCLRFVSKPFFTDLPTNIKAMMI